MKGNVQGLFKFEINCDLKKYIDDEVENTLSDLKDEIIDVVCAVTGLDIIADDQDIDIDTDESFIIYGKYENVGTYTSYDGDRENPPEFDSEYPTINEKKILKELTSKFKDYSFKIDFEEYPEEEEIL